jgi:hypothetical protein
MTPDISWTLQLGEIALEAVQMKKKEEAKRRQRGSGSIFRKVGCKKWITSFTKTGAGFARLRGQETMEWRKSFSVSGCMK